MKITQRPSANPRMKKAGILAGGTVVLNSKGNPCMVMRTPYDHTSAGKTQLVNLAHGGSYLTDSAKEYEVLDAELVWSHAPAVLRANES